ncbi:2-hydroxyacid dehydrogenase [Microbacterium sp. SORGH_AS_0888]|uniref:2-hydroxyacid dehydrogenase n=1 Tax=Microbacterium sp. SORGH_AS_0888 TaxID=3041791 RepID=UPI0027D786DC|nr:2-hydroxyacid dehydrogenase [Microbacterium sp. SORGH_AS_0888]
MTETLVVSVPDAQLAEALTPPPPGVELIVWSMDAAAPRPAIDIVVPPYQSQAAALPRLAGVRTRLVQSQSIGYEGLADLLPAGAVFANAASVHETSTAELALTLTLAAQREIPAFVREGEHGQWRNRFTNSLADRRVLLLGYGGVGKAVAARLDGFEAEVVPVASRARDEDGVHVHGIDELPELLPGAEVVILTLPGGDTTRHVIDDAALAALPDGALVVNVGRGPLIDTIALVDHVRRGRIRAALDVTDPEPLPADHALWTLPGVLVTPHVGGASAAMRPRLVRLIRDQIERMRRGEEPRNVVIG